MLSQFVSPYEQRKLGELDFNFPEGTNAVGRLDYASEGLLILTTDKTLSNKLLHPSKQHKRGYLVQVAREVSEHTLKRLRAGIDILIKEKGTYTTKPCEVNLIIKPSNLADRENELPENIPQSWLEFILTEGKNRQIRKMCRISGHKCWRLIRNRIEDLQLGNMQPGEVKEITKEELFRSLKIDDQ